MIFVYIYKRWWLVRNLDSEKKIDLYGNQINEIVIQSSSDYGLWTNWDVFSWIRAHTVEFYECEVCLIWF